MSARELKHPYITVKKDGISSYGGSQSWGPGKIMRKYGCGAAAGTDLLLYLSVYHGAFSGGDSKLADCGILDEKTYLELRKRMRRTYFPVIPGFGMPGWGLAAGLNAYFIRNKIPLRASFGVRRRAFVNRIRAMLAHDMPVILAVGPNVPLPLKRHKLTLYERRGEAYTEACKVTAHFVVITAAEGPWLQISSWGRRYYIRISEYMEYVTKYSSPLVSNLINIRKRK